MRFLLRGGLFVLLAFTAAVVMPEGNTAEPDNLLSSAVTAWKSGDIQTAEDALTQLANDGSTDPRVMYLRGIIAEQSGGDGLADLRAAAELEAAAGRSRLVNALLESVLGPLRGEIEEIRRTARARIMPDPKAARHSLLYARGLAALRAHDLDAALSAFDQAVQEDTTDPRVHYMRGVALARSGDMDAAHQAFRAGLAKENSGDDVRLVNLALQSVQGDIRQIIEEQVSVQYGSGVVSRQENRAIVMRQEELMLQDMLAADDERRAELLAQTRAAERSRQEQAAADILAAEQEAAAAAAIVNAPAETTPVKPEPDTPANTAPPVVAANPFGGTTTTPDSPAELPETTPVNPFLSGAGNRGTSDISRTGSGAAVDFSWLSPQSELLVFVRPAELLNSGFMQPIATMPQVQQGLAQATAAIGFSPADIDSITLGMSNVMAVMMQVGMQAQSGAQPDGQKIAQDLMTGGDAVAVIRSRTDVDFAPLAAVIGATTADHGGATYYRIEGENGQPPGAVTAIDSRTFLFGSEDSVKSALDRGAGGASNPMFGFVSGDSHLAIAFASPMMSIMSGSVPEDPNAPQFVQDLTAAIRGKISGSGLVITAGNDLTVSSVMALTDAASASAAATALKGAAQQGQQAFPQIRPMVPEKLQPIADRIVGSLTASSSGNTAAISATIPASLVTTLQESPEILGQLMMGAGGFGPPGAGGFGPPGGGGFAPAGGDPSQGFGFPPGGGSFPAENPSEGSTDNP